MKKHIYTVAGALCALLSLALAVLFVITLLPVGFDGVHAVEAVSVSSSPTDATEARYHVQVRGILLNDGDEPLAVDTLILNVSDGRRRETVKLAGFDLHSRLSHDLLYEWESDFAPDRVDAVYLSVDGEERRLENSAETLIGTDTVVTLALALLAALAALAFFKQMYYLHQEEEMQAG